MCRKGCKGKHEKHSRHVYNTSQRDFVMAVDKEIVTTFPIHQPALFAAKKVVMVRGQTRLCLLVMMLTLTSISVRAVGGQTSSLSSNGKHHLSLLCRHGHTTGPEHVALQFMSLYVTLPPKQSAV